jgi:hypothetical protein
MTAFDATATKSFAPDGPPYATAVHAPFFCNTFQPVLLTLVTK